MSFAYVKRARPKPFVSMQRYEYEKAEIIRTSKDSNELESRLKDLARKLGV